MEILMRFIKIFTIVAILISLQLDGFGGSDGNVADRVWRQGVCADDYVWTSNSFSGFLYDLDNNVGNESIRIHLKNLGSTYDRFIDRGDLEYSTNTQNIKFAYRDWGDYKIIGIMGKKLFSGYNNLIVGSSTFDNSLITKGKLCEVLKDSNNAIVLGAGSAIYLENGYELLVKSISPSENTVAFELAKNGNIIDNEVITSGTNSASTYIFEQRIDGEKIPVILAHVSNVLGNDETSSVTVDGLFQISDNQISIESVMQEQGLEVKERSAYYLDITNKDPINLISGSVQKISNSIGLKVARADVLRFMPVALITDNYEPRSSLLKTNQTTKYNFTPYNFEGFYYDLDDDLGDEELAFEIVPEDNGFVKLQEIEYSTSAQDKKFQFEDWGNYSVIGFLGKSYFAGYVNNFYANAVLLHKSTDENTLAKEELEEILIDDDAERTLMRGETLHLDQGYELLIKDLDDKKVHLELRKDGQIIDNKVISPSKEDASMDEETYYYLSDIGDVRNIAIIGVHFEKIFNDNEVEAAIVDGIFQISDNPIILNSEVNYGKMKISSISPSSITMHKDGSIMLSKNRDIELIPNFNIKAANQDDVNISNPLRLYIYKTVTSKESDKASSLEAPTKQQSPLPPQTSNSGIPGGITVLSPSAKVSPMETPAPIPVKQPGFESTFAVICLICVASSLLIYNVSKKI